MKKAIIFLNGNPPSVEALRKIDASDALVIAADGAYEYMKGIIPPDVILGDFDSLDGAEINCDAEIIRYNPEKDFTDGHLCVELAVKRGAKVVELYGAFGGRPDHEYANLSLLYQAKQSGAAATLYGNKYAVRLESGKITHDVNIGATVSLVPFFDKAHIITTKGLKYPMRDVMLDRLHILGISNEATADEFEVETQDELLVFIQTEK